MFGFFVFGFFFGFILFLCYLIFVCFVFGCSLCFIPLLFNTEDFHWLLIHPEIVALNSGYFHNI